MYIYDNLTCPIALISIIQIIVEMDSAIQDIPDISNDDIQYERGRPRIELSAEELIFFLGKNELKGTFNYYVTLFLANFASCLTLFTKCHTGPNPPLPRNVTLVCRPGLKPVIYRVHYYKYYTNDNNVAYLNSQTFIDIFIIIIYQENVTFFQCGRTYV